MLKKVCIDVVQYFKRNEYMLIAGSFIITLGTLQLVPVIPLMLMDAA